MLLAIFDLSTWVLLAASIAFLFFYFKDSYSNLPPGPPGWPIFGHLKMFTTSPRLHLEVTEMVKDYGNIIKFYIGSTYVFVLNGYDTMKEALVDKAEYFSERPTWMYTVQNYSRDTGIIFNPSWRDRRRFALISMRDFGLGKKSLEERMREEAGFLVEEIGNTNEKAVDLTKLFPYVTANIICAVINGERFAYDDEKFKEILQRMTDLARGPAHFCAQNFIPIFRYISTPKFEVFDRGFREITDVAKMWQKEHKESFDPDNIRDLIDLFIAESRKPGSNFKGESEASSRMKMAFIEWCYAWSPTVVECDEDLVGCICDLFLAGTETTSTTLSWAVLHLINYPDVQRKCREEIHREIGAERMPEYNDIKKLPYLNGVMNEVQRLGNIVPFSVWHSANTDVQLGGYTIPKGSLVLQNMHTALRDPKYWTEPDAFKPERWLDENNKVINIPGFIPFSIGKRVCLGEQLAKKELFLFLAAILQKFTFTPEDVNNPPSLEGISGGIHGPGNFLVKAYKL